MTNMSNIINPGNMIMMVPNLKNSTLLFIFPITHALSHTAVTGQILSKSIEKM